MDHAAIPPPVCAAGLDLHRKLAALPFLLALMFMFAFLLPSPVSGRVVGSLFERLLQWLIGPEFQERVITNKRRRGFVKF